MASIIWPIWAGTACVDCSESSTSTASTVWHEWAVVETTATTCSSGTTYKVWATWNPSAATTAAPHSVVTYRAPELTEEQKQKLAAERAAREEQRRQEEEKRKQEQKVADEKAEKLLRSCLTQRQRRMYHRTKSFCVQARDGARFRLTRGWSGNVVELDKRGRAVARYCLHPRDRVPEPDNLLTQKLLLETDPERFRKTANRTALPVG